MQKQRIEEIEETFICLQKTSKQSVEPKVKGSIAKNELRNTKN